MNLAISPLNSIEPLTSKVLINSNITHDKLLLLNIVLKECNNIKEDIKSSNNKFIV